MNLNFKNYILFTIGFLALVMICISKSSKSSNIISPASSNSFPKDIPVKIKFAHQFENTVVPVKFDLKEIKKRKKLIALTGFNNTSYFIYKGTPMGFEYEMLTRFAEHLGVELEVVVVKDATQLVSLLNKGEGDIIADQLIVTKEKEKSVNFSISVSQTRQVLIQRKPLGWDSLNAHLYQKKLLRNPINLIGKEVYVIKDSPYFHRLQNLSEEIGGDIKVVEVSGETDEEELISQVAEGKIMYTVADESLALINRACYSNIDVETPIGFPQRVAWAVRENAPDLLGEINEWLTIFKKDPVYKHLYHKYYLNKNNGEKYIRYRMGQNKIQQISHYDKMIIKYAKELNWDWRLLASLIYQESRFDPEAKSWVGAAGLMQLMPTTAKNFGIKDLNDPEQSLKAGISYIKWLDNYWKKRVPEKEERIKFIMASYNVGQEHIADAQRLAKKYNKNPFKWDENVAYFILQKSNPKYWNDPVVKYGYCRGRETYDYVNQVLKRFNHYKNFAKENV